MRLLPLIAALLLADASSAATLPPRDECGKDASFVAFRQQLSDAVARKDTEALLKLSDEHVRLGFAGDDGKVEFKGELGKGERWAELAKLFRLGCAIDGERYIMPYMFARTGERDPFDTFVAAGTGIALRAAPRAGGWLVTRLSWEMLSLVPDAMNSGDWVHVRTDAGRTGYVHRSLVRSPVDYRAIFEKSVGGWRMTAFLAGD